jgi:heat shock protein HslJ
MTALRLRPGGKAFVGALALALAGFAGAAPAAQPFPFDQMLRLDVRPMRLVKRVPILTVSRDGEATIGLWCKTLRGRVQVSDQAIRIEPGPIPQALPRYMVDGQCSEARMQADLDTLTALIQVTGWRARGDALVLTGPKTFRFRASSN